MGTPDFAVPPLKALAGYDGCRISMVITQPDRPSGRGRKKLAPPVKQVAVELGLNVLQPEAMDSPEILEILKSHRPDFFVVAAFGHKLTREVLDIPAVLPINIHASLLPSYRGASPIQAAILNMDKEAGITTMIMDTKLDTGDMLLKSSTPLAPNDTAQTLHDRLSLMGAELIIKTIEGLVSKQITPEPQDHSRASYAPMLKKEDGRIDWCKTKDQIEAQVRAMTPWPGAFTFMNDKRIKILEVKPMDIQTEFEPGTVFACDCDEIHVAAGEGAVAITKLQGASGKCLCSDEYLRGNRLDTGECFL